MKNPVLRTACVLRQGRGAHNASLTVGEGQIVTVIGPNGAGKTTMLSAIMGVLLPSRARSPSTAAWKACPRSSAWSRAA